MLPHVTAALERAGIKPENIRILIATGLHREATPAELDEILGPEILSRYWVDSHRARNLDEQADLGITTGGTHAYVDRRFVETDLHITLGFVEPHLMAGFSGGRKLISIGLAVRKLSAVAQPSLICAIRKQSRGPSPTTRCIVNCWKSPPKLGMTS